jgi:hypothetical protein
VGAVEVSTGSCCGPLWSGVLPGVVDKQPIARSKKGAIQGREVVLPFQLAFGGDCVVPDDQR